MENQEITPPDIATLWNKFQDCVAKHSNDVAAIENKNHGHQGELDVVMRASGE